MTKPRYTCILEEKELFFFYYLTVSGDILHFSVRCTIDPGIAGYVCELTYLEPFVYIDVLDMIRNSYM